MSRFVRMMGMSIAVVVPACGDASELVETAEGDAGTLIGACAPLNLTRQCGCGASLGMQNCLATGWAECACAGGSAPVDAGIRLFSDAGSPPTVADGTPSGNLRADIVFDWLRSEASPGTCEAGKYSGKFTGIYLPQTAYAAPIPVFDLANGDRPGLAFTLEQSANGEELQIANGYVKGTADGLFPFDAALTGTLDCKTSTFTGVLDGYYKIPIPFVEGPYKFKGPVTGKYDKNAHVFLLGTWTVGEYDPPPILPIYGGQGEWNAVWEP